MKLKPKKQKRDQYLSPIKKYIKPLKINESFDEAMERLVRVKPLKKKH